MECSVRTLNPEFKVQWLTIHCPHGTGVNDRFYQVRGQETNALRCASSDRRQHLQLITTKHSGMTISYILQKGVVSNDQRARDFARVANTIELLPDWVCKLVEQCVDRMVLQFFGDTTITIIAPKNYPREPARVDDFKRVRQLIGLSRLETMVFDADATMFNASFAYIFTNIVTKLCVKRGFPMPRIVRILQESIYETTPNLSSQIWLS
ncbi:hypothetical protein ACTXT7_015351 [Hymenolepis weldensis]